MTTTPCVTHSSHCHWDTLGHGCWCCLLLGDLHLVKNRQGKKRPRDPRPWIQHQYRQGSSKTLLVPFGYELFLFPSDHSHGPTITTGKVKFPFLVDLIRCAENIFPPTCSKMGLCPHLLCAPQNRPSFSWERFPFPRSSVFMVLVKHQCTSIKLS